MEEPGRGPATAATLTSATTGVATWAVARYAFHGQIPPEVYGFVQLAVPALLGWGASWIAQRRQECRTRRLEALQALPGPDAPQPPPDATAGAA